MKKLHEGINSPSKNLFYNQRYKRVLQRSFLMKVAEVLNDLKEVNPLRSE